MLVLIYLRVTLLSAANDLKLSDGGGWRAGCMVGERRRQEAASVVAGAVKGMGVQGAGAAGEWRPLNNRN